MLSTSPGPHSGGPAVFTDLREVSPSPPPRADIPDDIPLPPLRHRSGSAVSLPPLRPGERSPIRVVKRRKQKPTAILASTDPAPEARVNPRTNTEPPAFEPPRQPSIHHILGPSSSPSFQQGLSSDVDLPGFSASPSPEIPDPLEVPEPQIEAHCPEFQHMKL